MIYKKIDGKNIKLTMIEGFDQFMNKKVKMCIVTDGEIEYQKNDKLNKRKLNLEEFYSNNEKTTDSSIYFELLKVHYVMEKNIEVNNFNYLSIFYYIYLEKNQTWASTKPAVFVNNRFGIIDEVKFMKYQDKLPRLPYMESEPGIIINRELDDHIEKKIIKSFKVIK